MSIEYEIITTAENPNIIVYTKELKKNQVCYLTILCLGKALDMRSCIYNMSFRIVYKENLEITQIDKKLISELLTCDCYVELQGNNINVRVLGNAQNIIWVLSIDDYVI